MAGSRLHGGDFPTTFTSFIYMKEMSLKQWGRLVALLTLLVLPEIASAQTYFTVSGKGDLLAGFRKTGTYVEQNEMVVYLGNITNFLTISAGTTINITNYSHLQITNMCPDNLGHLNWSVFSTFQAMGFPDGPWVTPVGSFPKASIWYTLARINPGVQTTPPPRNYYNLQGIIRGAMLGVGTGAESISQSLATTNAFNNTVLVTEPTADTGSTLTTYIGDRSDSTLGDFSPSGEGLTFSVENTNPASFTSPTVSDLYQSCSAGVGLVDPYTGQTNGSCYYVGYFTMKTDGTMTFTRATVSTVPIISAVQATTATNGFAPLSVVFTNTATGSITNWVWNFGNGTIITNTTGADVTNSYTSGGSYTVTLTVYGPGGAATNILASYIITSPTPVLGKPVLSGGNFVLSGSNCPAGVQYRILTSTNLTLPLAIWKPVTTNTFLSNGTYSFTTAPTNTPGFFRLISP